MNHDRRFDNYLNRSLSHYFFEGIYINDKIENINFKDFRTGLLLECYTDGCGDKDRGHIKNLIEQM